MKWPSDFPHMTGRAGPTFVGTYGLGGKFAHKNGQWFHIGKRPVGVFDTRDGLADRDVELVSDLDALAKLGSAPNHG